MGSARPGPGERPVGPVPGAPSPLGRTLGVDATALLLLGLGALSALKGLNLIVTPTSSYLYYTDYRFGFVLRGLVGQLFSPVLAALPPSAHDDLLLGWHYALVAALLAALSRFAARTVAATGGRPEVLAAAALLFCSPLIPSLAYFTAAPDVLLCLLALGIAGATRARRLPLAWLLFLAGTLVHQLMVFLALPLMVLGSLVHARRPVRAAAGSLAVGLAACLVVLLAPAPDARLVERFVEQGGMLPDEALDMHGTQLGQRSAEMLGVMAGLWRENPVNGAIAVAFGACAAAAILAACLLSPGALRPGVVPLPPLVPPGGRRAALTALLALGAGLGPLLVLAFAWDLSRLAVLSTLTAFLAADMLLRRGPAARAAPPPRSGLAAASACGVLAAVFLLLPFVGLWFKGTHLNTRGPLVPSPVLEIGATRAAVVGLTRLYEANARQGPPGDDPAAAVRRRSPR